MDGGEGEPGHVRAGPTARAAAPYDDNDVSDEFYWAAAELFITTGEAAVPRRRAASPHAHRRRVFRDGGFDWASTAPLARLDLATVPNELADRDRVRRSVVAGRRRRTSPTHRDQAVRPAVRAEQRRVRLGLQQR